MYKGQTSLLDEIIVDNFAGGGGSSTGIELAAKLYSIYKQWAQNNGEYVLSGTKFGREMGRKLKKIKKHGNFYYSDIRINEDPQSFVTFGG